MSSSNGRQGAARPDEAGPTALEARARGQGYGLGAGGWDLGATLAA